MKLTRVQRKLLEALVESDGEITSEELSEKFDINNSDIVREGTLFKNQGYVSFQERGYVEVDYLDGFEAYRERDLPEFTLLKKLEKEFVITSSNLEGLLKKQEIGPAINELIKLGLISTEREDKEAPLIIIYKPNGTSQRIVNRNETLKIIREQNVLDARTKYFEEFDSCLEELEKRKLVRLKERTVYTLKIFDDGRKILASEITEEVTILTPEIIANGSWKETNFKEYDPTLESKRLVTGKLHPLRQLALYVERIFRDMGYEFMAGGLVVDSFHNFDALFTQQDHPAREMQDTFFLEYPMHCKELPEGLIDRVRETHEKAFKYNWNYRIAQKNILRTHTTAVTAKYLAERNEVPLKLFSIGRVFRNEKIDAMHLPEFHQIEGVVVGDVNLRDLIGHISTFYGRIGLKDIKFKKTFNPYTEPSMEIYAYHPTLNKHIEVGNSGMFRPEMLNQFGYGDQRAIAWGLALERLASIIYDKPKIKDLIGTEVDIDWLRGESKLWL